MKNIKAKVDVPHALKDEGYGIVCMSYTAYKVCRRLMSTRGLWKSTYYNASTEGFSSPSDQDVGVVMDRVEEFLGGGIVSCEEMVEVLNGVVAAIEAVNVSLGQINAAQAVLTNVQVVSNELAATANVHLGDTQQTIQLAATATSCCGGGSASVTQLATYAGPDVDLSQGDYPEGFVDVEEYSDFKCRMAQKVYADLIWDVGFWGTLEGLGDVLKVAKQAGIVLLTPIPHDDIVVLASTLIGFLVVAESISSMLVALDNNKDDFICETVRSVSVEDARSRLSALIASFGLFEFEEGFLVRHLTDQSLSRLFSVTYDDLSGFGSECCELPPHTFVDGVLVSEPTRYELNVENDGSGEYDVAVFFFGPRDQSEQSVLVEVVSAVGHTDYTGGGHATLGYYVGGVWVNLKDFLADQDTGTCCEGFYIASDTPFTCTILLTVC